MQSSDERQVKVQSTEGEAVVATDKSGMFCVMLRPGQHTFTVSCVQSICMYIASVYN